MVLFGTLAMACAVGYWADGGWYGVLLGAGVWSAVGLFLWAIACSAILTRARKRERILQEFFHDLESRG